MTDSNSPEQYFIDNLWRWKCDLPDKEIRAMPSLESLKQTEWSENFENLMRNRLIMGALRYGVLHQPGKPQYDRIGSIRKRIEIYAESGNKECLVDIANICICEFEEVKRVDAHFNATDDAIHAAIVTINQ
jgi:hypothetical protein